MAGISMWRYSAPLVLTIAIVFSLYVMYQPMNETNPIFMFAYGGGGGGGSTTSATTVCTTTTVKTTMTTVATDTSVTTSASTTAATTSIQPATTIVEGQTTTIHTGESQSTSSASTTVPSGVGGYHTTTVPTTIIVTTTVAQMHGNLVLSETGLPSGVLFAGYLESDPSVVYATNTSVNDSILFPNIDSGVQIYKIFNVTAGGSGTSGGFLYQPVPASGNVSISNNQTATQAVRFVSTQITTTDVPTTTIAASSNGGGLGGIVSGVASTISNFFYYLFKGGT